MKESKRTKSPWFAFYVDDFVSGTISMSMCARGAFVSLLAYQFSNGSIPSDERTLCRITGAFPDEWAAVKAEVLPKFQSDENGNLFNVRMDKERIEREEIRQKKITAGRKGGRPPKKASGLANENHQVKQNESKTEPTGKASPSPSPSKDSNELESLSAPTGKPDLSWSKSEGFGGITEADSEAWAEAYPACNIPRQLAAANQWLLSNPAKAKKKAWRRFITGWLSRAQERGGDIQSNAKNNRNQGSRNAGTANQTASSEYGRI